MSAFVYDAHTGDLGTLDTEAGEVIVVSPAYIPSSAHEFVDPDLGATILGREAVTLAVTNVGGEITVAFDVEPDVDITSTTVGGWVVCLDGASDAVRSLLVYQDHPGGVAADPLPIVTPDGIAKVTRP